MSVLDTTSGAADVTTVVGNASVDGQLNTASRSSCHSCSYDLDAEFATDPGDLSVPGASPERGLAAFESLWVQLRAHLAGIDQHWRDERGMSTIEYALGCIAAAALGALLYTVVTSDAVEQALSGIFQRALSEG